MVLAALLLVGSGVGSASVAMPINAPLGIPRELAEVRAAQLSELHYGLRYTLTPHAATSEGVEHLRFKLAGAGSGEPLLLDFRDGSVESLAVNGAATAVVESNGHLVLPAAALRVGANEVEVHFAANV